MTGIIRRIILYLGIGVPTIPEIHEKIIRNNFNRDELKVIKRDGATCSYSEDDRRRTYPIYHLSRSYDTSTHDVVFRISRVARAYEYVTLDLQETKQFLERLPTMLPRIKLDIAKKILDHGSEIAESENRDNKERETKQTLWKSI